MYLPRSLISHLYLHLLRTHHPLSPPVLLLVALEPDSLCACRILTTLLKRDYIPHKIQPIAGYGDLASAGEGMVRPMRTSEGGNGGVVVCLGVGGLVDLGAVLGIESEEGDLGGVEVWVVDARRPWNLGNVFGGMSHLDEQQSRRRGVDRGRIEQSYHPGQGGIIVFDDGDIDEELGAEREAYCALAQMPDVDDDGEDSDDEDDESINDGRTRRKRKSCSDAGEEDSEEEDIQRPQRRRRTDDSFVFAPSRSRSASPRILDSNTTSPPADPSPRALRRRLRRLRRKHQDVLHKYYELGNSYSEPVSSLMYSLASELGREDNDLLWLSIIGVGSLDLYGRSMIGVGITHTADDSGLVAGPGWGGERIERIRQILRDEVRRLNPPTLSEAGPMNRLGEGGMDAIPTHARSPTDTAIRLSPEPHFLLIRHWSLYDSMLHSPYLSARLHIWSDAGRKRLHKLLAKMGVSLTQCKQSYTHMDMDLKRGLRARLRKYAPVYGLDGLVPPEASAARGREGWGFVRNWGFKACLSSADVGVIIGAILEVGKGVVMSSGQERMDRARGEDVEPVDVDGRGEGEEWVGRFWQAYDALENIDALKSALPTAMHLHRAILRTGTALLEKKQIRHLRAFRMAVVKEGPDVSLFTHPAALTKLALWLGQAIVEQERERKGGMILGKGGRGTPLVVAGLNERRGVYVVVGTGRGGGAIATVRAKEKEEKKEKKRKEREARKAERERRRAAAEENDGEEQEEEEEEDDDDESSDDDDEDAVSEEITKRRGYGLNRFGNAFQEVVEETNARVRIDSFEHCVVEVRADDLAAFLEALSMKTVVG
ncbi:MAG: hypothetical protein M1823_005887 [Watsoniomyces obsoletus]|nr:MAG: hypothetical protein M1823_005887 [Watsoniomyces obsoletus]